MKRNWTLSQKKSLLGVLFIGPWFLGFVFLFAVPLYESLVYSFNHLTVAMSGFDTKFAGLQFYKEIFTNTRPLTACCWTPWRIY